MPVNPIYADAAGALGLALSSCEVRGARRWLFAFGLACSCRPQPFTLPAPEPQFQVLGEARQGEAGAPLVGVSGRTVIIRGTAMRLEGGELHGEFDLSEPGTVRLTLYDSLPGRAVDQALPRGTPSQPTRYEGRIGPLAVGVYDVVVGHYDAGRHLVVVGDTPVRVRVGDGE